MAKFPLNPTEKGFVVAILELGCWAGAWFAGYFADKIGRKFTIVLGTIIFLLGASLVCLEHLEISRLVQTFSL
jgi:MFS family permease